MQEQHVNTMIPWTTGDIVLGPSGNAQGGHSFFSLTSGKQLLQNQWTVLPMPANIINRLHKMSRRSPNLPALEFANRAGVSIDDDDNDSEYDEDDDDNDIEYDEDDDDWGDDNDNPNLDPAIEPVDDQIAVVDLDQVLGSEEFDKFEQNVELENMEKNRTSRN
jgi:hypothetical protein